MNECGSNPRTWRDTASLILMAVLALAVLSVVFDGGRSAFAADDCQYGQYGQYGPYGQYGQYGQYGPYGQQCPKAKPTLTLGRPATAGIGLGVVPFGVLGNGDGPTGTLTFRVLPPG